MRETAPFDRPLRQKAIWGWMAFDFAAQPFFTVVITFVFGDRVRFEGMLHGVVPLIIVVTVMVIAEELIVRFVRWVR